MSTEKRHPDYPGVPTMSESGFPGFDEYTQGLGVAGRPACAITEGGSTPAEFRAWLAQDLERWARVIKAAGVKAD